MKIKDLWIMVSVVLSLHLSGCGDSDTDESINSGSGKAGNEHVVYEVNPGLFSPNASFNAIANRLDDIKALGVNVLWLMPTYEQGVLKSFGSPYCVKDYKKINPAYGTLADLRALVDKAHGKGMKVILDWVANHTSWDNTWMQNKSWYTQDAAGNIISPAGMGWDDVADLNFNNQDMRNAMIDAMKYWISEASIDGYRCDYAEGVPDDFWKQSIAELRKIKGDDLIMLAEGGKNALFGDGFDIVYGWDFAAKLQSVYKGGTTLAQLYQTHKEEYSGIPTGKQRLRYSTNHDLASENSPIKVFNGERGAMSAFVIATTLGGSPLIYSSQETGYANELSFFNYSQTFNWNANPSYLNEYKKLMTAYNASDALRKGDLKTYSTEKVACYYRSTTTEKVFVVVNTRGEAQTIKTPIERAGDSVKNLMDNTTTVLATTLTLEPYQYYIWQKQ